MIVNRIKDFNIQDRGLLSVIYGNTDDIFVGGDLRKYGFYEMLYLYLKSIGYDIVLLHDEINYFYAYTENDLALYLGINTPPVVSNSEANTNSGTTSFGTPFGGTLRRRNNTPNPAQPTATPIQTTTHKSWVKVGENNEQIYRLQGRGEEFAYLTRALKDKKRKTAIIFRVASTSSNTFIDEGRKTLLASIEEDYAVNELSNKVILSFGAIKDEISLIRALHDDIIELFTKTQNDQIQLKSENSFFVGLPDREEINNFIQRKRLWDNVEIFGGKPIDKIILSLLQKQEKLNKLSKLNLAQHIESVSSKSAWDRLRELKGLENVAQQIETIVAQLKAQRKRGNTGSIRPHLCFKGNPGTGKTTLAAIVAEIFKEEGILGIGHLIDAKVGDMIGEHVGSTRPKTAALFEKAKGGILFIDEAYGLLENRSEGGSFASEAIETMIQKMDEKTWRDSSLVILAGYTNQIDELLQKGNPGLMRRFSPQNQILFEDYRPEVLVDIIKWNFKKLGYETSEPDFDTAIQQIIARLYALRPSNWGNAGEMENFASEIDAMYIANHATDNVLRMVHIPHEKLKLINPNLGGKQKGILQLDALIGLSNVKNTIRNIFNQLRIDQLRGDRGAKRAEIYRMNFVFRGNPGTGKTTVARIIGNLLSELGLLKEGTPIEKGRSDLVGGYQGQTAIKVNEAFKESIGKTLFIDEVYSLVTGSQDNFGLEAVNEIVRHMTLQEFDGKMAIIIAGYPDDVANFLNYNDGLSRRFNYYIDFEDYSNEELLEIYKIKLLNSGLSVAANAEKLAIDFFSKVPRNKGFENAGLADRLLGITKSNLDNRISTLLNNGQDISDETLSSIIDIDFPNYKEVAETVQSVIIPNEKVSLQLYSESQNFDIEAFKANVGILTNGQGAGTAFLIAKEGIILTANHNLKGGGNFTFRHHQNATEYTTKLLWVSHKIDMAILKLETEKEDFPYFNLVQAQEEIIVGEDIVLIGYPGGGMLSKDPFCPENKIEGISQNFEIDEQIQFDAIYTYANATHGYSGGPVIRKKDGKVIGVLHGGIVKLANVNLISDIRQIYEQDNLAIIH